MKDEFSFIKNISPKETFQSSLVKGIGDDAAVYRGSSDQDEVVCVDTMVEGVHFLRKTLSPYQLGKKALAVNVSDLAAMGAFPAYYLVSIAIPPTWSEGELIEIFAGMASLAKKYKMDLIGGDTVSTTDALVVTVTVIGQVKRGQALYRHTARPGDVLFLTGNVGTSALGLEQLLKKDNHDITEVDQKAVCAHQEPSPHVAQGQVLAKFNARLSLNDVSDGVASEAYEIAEASEVRMTIDGDKIPFHKSMEKYSDEERLRWALFGGEDYVLIGTVAKEHVSRLRAIFNADALTFHVIGCVEEGKPEIFLKSGDTITKVGKKGYNHFK